jgi:hypothetical protein
MAEAKEKGFIDRESQIRQVALRVTTALSILLVSLLFFLIFPFFPRELMWLVSIGLGVLGYKAPTPALILWLLFALPGYFYQLDSALPIGTGLPISLVVIMFITLLTIWIVASEKSESLGAVAGTAAVILMLTPLYYLSLPLIIGVSLFRTKGLKTRAASALLTFMVLYYPVLVINNTAPVAGLVPILDQIQLHSQLPIPVMSLSEILTYLGKIVDTSHDILSFPFLANLADYWPLSPNQRLIPVGILFCLIAVVAISTAGGTQLLLRSLEKRDVGRKYIPYASKALSLLAGMLVFVLLASILTRPLSFINPLGVSSFLFGTVIVGAVWTLAGIWIKGRDHALQLRSSLVEKAGSIRAQRDLLSTRIVQTKITCQRIDTAAEEALCQICLQELAFIDQTLNEMPLKDMEQKYALFQDLHNKLDTSIPESHTKICHYYDNERQKYNDFLKLAQQYGFPMGESPQEPKFSQVTSMSFDEILKLQKCLNTLYKTTACALGESIEKLETILSSEVDPDFQRTGIHIARNYLTGDCYADALQEFLLELGEIEHALQESLAGLDEKAVDITGKLRATLTEVLLPTAVNMGDVNGVQYYQATINKVANLSFAINKDRTLPDLMNTVAQVSELGRIMTDFNSILGEKLLSLEKNIMDKTPRGYSWGVDPDIRTRIDDISQKFRKPSGSFNIHDRLSLLSTGPSAVNSAALAIKDYYIAHELLINYSNIEHLLEERLWGSGSIGIDDLPVKRQYARHYLRLYCQKHPLEVYLEADTGRLTKRYNGQEVSQNAGRR